MKIVFMGTPHFGAKTLEGLLETKASVKLVITQPDRPKGRGLNTAPCPVKKLAVSKNIEVITPEKIKTSAVTEKINSINPDLIVVSAYGKIIPRKILDIPSLYCINVHASLLPKYRGAAPINWAIVKGEKVTGITIMQMNEMLDSGDIMFQKEVSIDDNEDSGALHDRLALLGKEAIKEAIEIINCGKASFTRQNDSMATFAPILKKENGLINWDLSSKEIFNFIRGMNPWPGAFTFLGEKTVKIFKSSFRKDICVGEDVTPGKVVSTTEDSIIVKTKDGTLFVEELQLESKKRLKAGRFIAGYPGLIGKKFGGRVPK